MMREKNSEAFRLSLMQPSQVVLTCNASQHLPHPARLHIVKETGKRS